jgi:hypothetical protein
MLRQSRSFHATTTRALVSKGRRDLTANLDSPFVRDGDNKLIRRSYWLDMDDRTLVMVMTKDISANLTNDQKRTHLIDINAST